MAVTAPLLGVCCNQQGTQTSNCTGAANGSSNINARLDHLCCCMCCWCHQAGCCYNCSCHLLQLGVLLCLALHDANPCWARLS